MTLKSKSFSAVRWTTIAAIVRAALQVVQVTVLARLLSPEDYGLMAMVGVVLSFTALFADLGLNSAFMQRRDVTLEQRSSLFWLNVVLSVGLTLLVIAASPLLAWFFGDKRLSPLMMLSASTFILGTLGVQVRLAAEKELDFRPIMLLEIAVAILGFIASLSAAFSGWGVYSLVLGGIVSAFFSTAFAWMFMARGWRPMWRLRMKDVRPYLKFGGAMVANNIVNQINMTVDLLLGGRLLGASQLGLYSVPRNLVLQLQFMVNPIITRVGFPLIAQVQNDVVRVGSIYLKTMNMTASTNAPLYVGIAVFAPEIVMIMLGDGWQSSAPLLRVLAAWGFFRSTMNPVGSLLFGMGRADLSLKWNLTMLLILPPVMWFGSKYGAAGLTWALLGLYIFLFVPGWFFLVRPLCRLSLFNFSVATLRPLVLALLSLLPAYLIALQFNGAPIRLILGGVVSVPLYLALSYSANREWLRAMMELIVKRRPDTNTSKNSFVK
ncbi:Colanic acid exporter [Candidatus Methylobacter favarea]|uniref:Colanic acid exporter n=1 Tax=Candidatus Methylobacter favarea TaxID=2707345 RepID=A0A8S0Y925_9GAMM|nr:MOP flippase family protein [Candidatus Methylobacter favarea]CAA9889566.1 Colanic acid exporter [Candidatus Methylobacter favarea]